MRDVRYTREVCGIMRPNGHVHQVRTFAEFRISYYHPVMRGRLRMSNKLRPFLPVWKLNLIIQGKSEFKKYPELICFAGQDQAAILRIGTQVTRLLSYPRSSQRGQKEPSESFRWPLVRYMLILNRVTDCL